MEEDVEAGSSEDEEGEECTSKDKSYVGTREDDSMDNRTTATRDNNDHLMIL